MLRSQKNKIIEAVDVNTYKRLLRVLGEYTQNLPATGMDRLFDLAIEKGKKILPKDKKALAILGYVLGQGSAPVVVQKLLNLRFSLLPVEYKPLVKKGRKQEVAFWMRGDLISDRVKDLIDWDGSGKGGSWSDMDGNKVTLVEI